MAAGMVLTVAQTLFTALQCQEVRELCSMLTGYESKLEDLQRNVNTIKAVLLDAEFKHRELNNEGRVWFEELKDAVYDADDFFDELTTKAQLKKLSGKKVSKRVCRFFSSENQLLSAFNTSHKIKLLREKLDSIADNRIKFGFSGENRPIRRREETCSYVYESNIIGREKEKEEIVEMLLSELTSHVSFVSIVGMGGLGKTALAQLVFNDKRIRDVFSEGLYWVCVSEEFGLKQILCKFLNMRNSECTLEKLQQDVQEKIKEKKYFLVLDDVWQEDPHKWLDLKGFLCSGGAGSRILVTSRSREVAHAVDKELVFDLKGLSEENSWKLFKKIAFGEGDDHVHDTRLVEIGKDIVKKCANVPLSIRVISSLLHGRDESKWEEFRDMDLANMRPYGDGQEDDIMSTLMFSYYSLTPELKSCFSFCSLFPKDYRIEKEMLISLWLAQGYLDPSPEGKSMEDVGEDYFCILLQRCFFQDVKQDEYGNIKYCKIHDLMHDLAMKVAGKESLMLTDSTIGDINQKLRHLSAIGHDAAIDSLFSKDCPSRKTLRTILMRSRDLSRFEATLELNYRHLRVLHLEDCDMNPLRDELGKLLRLRYLDLSYCPELKMLPKSITKLYNLQILNLRECGDLMELPQDIGKLVNLRMLDIRGCYSVKEVPKCIVELINLRMLKIYENFHTYDGCKITYMPAGMGKLTNLQTLTYFVVGGDSSTQVQKGELTDLKSLISLKGYLCIKVGRFSPSNMPIATKGADILTKACLSGLEIFCEYNRRISLPLDQGEYQETLLEGLNPNNDHLRELAMMGYQGVKFPKWGLGKFRFPAGIVRMELTYCVGLKHLSLLSKLVYLKYLDLSVMKKLEYIEKDTPSDAPSETFFPSLEELRISEAVELKGWWREITWKVKDGEGCLEDANGRCVEVLPSFPRLRLLEIKKCESLRYFPPCPHLKILELRYVNQALTFCMKKSTYFHQSLVKDTNLSTSSSSSDSLSNDPTVFCLEKVRMDSVQVFNSFFHESFLSSVHTIMSTRGYSLYIRRPTSVRNLTIRGCDFLSVSKGIESSYDLGCGEADEEMMSWKFLSSPSNLELCFLEELVKLPKGLQYLTSLQSLKIERCCNLEELGENFGYLTSLRSLYIKCCPKLKSLSKELQYSTSLQSLKIEGCYNLEDIGEIFGPLTSLKSLHIEYCPKLKSLPKGLQYLTSLLSLKIISCENLEELAENFGIPTSLKSLHIEYCPKLKSLPEAVHHIPHFKFSNNN